MTVLFGRFGYESSENTAAVDTATDFMGGAAGGVVAGAYNEGSDSSSSSGGGWLDSLTSIFKSTSQGVQAVSAGLVNIHGQPINYAPPPAPAVPIWVYILVPVAVVGGIVMLKKSRRSSVAGYRRRRSRR